MYSLYGRPQPPKPRWRAPLIIFVVLSVIAGVGWYGYRFYQQNSELSGFWQAKNTETVPAEPTPAEIAETARSKPASAVPKGPHINKQLFALDLPADWSFGTYESSPYHVYNFETVAQKSGSRTLRMYVDTIPDVQAVSHLLAVQPLGNKLKRGTISGPCSSLVSAGVGQPTATVRYDGADFLCNTASVDNGTVGISSAATPGRIRLASLESGLHVFSFLYADTTPKPDYTPLYKVLDSFTVK